jgi:hypothetical protein
MTTESEVIWLKASEVAQRIGMSTGFVLKHSSGKSNPATPVLQSVKFGGGPRGGGRFRYSPADVQAFAAALANAGKEIQ